MKEKVLLLFRWTAYLFVPQYVKAPILSNRPWKSLHAITYKISGFEKTQA